MSADQTINLLVSVFLQTASLPLEMTKAQAQVRYINHNVSNPRPMVFGSDLALKGGVSALYIGASTMAVRAGLYTLLRTNIYLPLFTAAAAEDKYGTVPVGRRGFYSCVASGIAAFALNPLDLILLRQQVDNTLSQPRGYKGLFDALEKAGKPGFGHLYKGASWNAAKWGIYAGSLLSIYDSFSEFWPRVLGEFVGNKAMAVSCATLFSCAFSLPLDNIRTKVQYQTNGLYKNGLDALSRTLAREGFFGLYVGYWHYYARSTITAYSAVVLIDLLRNAVYD